MPCQWRRPAIRGAAVISSAPQPIGAVFAYVMVEQAEAVLPASLAFAAGAMLAVIALELAPSAWRGQRTAAAAGAFAGAALMLALAHALAV